MNEVTTLDYFAAEAMTVIMMAPSRGDIKKLGPAAVKEHIAGASYDMAEAMMKEREKRNAGKASN